MCVHREHRTGNCRVCMPHEPGTRAALMPGTPDTRAASMLPGPVVEPQLWDGDDS